MKRCLRSLLVGVILSLTLTAPATAAHKSGHISQVFLSAPTNAAFRIYLDSGLTGCAANFAYINADFGNYQAYVSALMTAYSTNKTIDLTYQTDSGGYCVIMEFLVH
jgi:hypothetical protein